MKNKITGVIAILILFFLSKGCISDYMKGGDKAAIAQYEKMLADDTKTTAQLRNEYKEVTIKIMKMPVKTYEFKYDYTVNEMPYSGEHTFSELPATKDLEVYYLKESPSVSCVNPQSKLSGEKEKNSSKGPLYWGIGWGILCALATIGFIAEVRGKA